MLPQRRPLRYLFTLVILACVAGALALGSQVHPSRAQESPAIAERLAIAPLVPTDAVEAQPTQQPTVVLASPAALPEAPQLTATPTRTPTPINIGNFVWDDLDKDGRQDAGEPGLAGVTVQLWNAAKTSLLDADVTDGNGIYTVTAPVPGDYRVRVLLPSALDSFSPKEAAGVDTNQNSDINPSGPNLGFTDSFTLASNVISTTIYDAGIIVFRPPTPTRTPTPINIGNFVWVDLNANGIQDSGEPGLGNVAVQLWNSERTVLIDETVTSPNGAYTVVAPVPGEYRVRVLLPSGASFAPKDQGSDDLKDSDINRLVFVTTFGFSDAFTLASNVISTTIYDAGLINVPPTSTPSLTTTGTLPPPTSTNTPTATLTPATPPAGLDSRLYLPMLQQ